MHESAGNLSGAVAGHLLDGGAAPEVAYYGVLANLLNDIGETIRPKVRCVMNLKQAGAGMPDGGLFLPDQFQKAKGTPLAGQLPARGAIEAKPPTDDVADIVASEQVERYCRKYGLVLVTNYREFVLVAT